MPFLVHKSTLLFHHPNHSLTHQLFHHPSIVLQPDLTTHLPTNFGKACFGIDIDIDLIHSNFSEHMIGLSAINLPPASPRSISGTADPWQAFCPRVWNFFDRSLDWIKSGQVVVKNFITSLVNLSDYFSATILSSGILRGKMWFSVHGGCYPPFALLLGSYLDLLSLEPNGIMQTDSQ